MVWSGTILQYQPEAWRINLTDDHISELGEAAARFEGKHGRVTNRVAIGMSLTKAQLEDYRLSR